MDATKSVWKRTQARIGGWDLPVMILWAITLFCIGPFVLLQVFSSNERYGAIPVPIHSQSEADYSRDPRNRYVPVISLNILRDLMLGGEDLDEITWLQTLTATHNPQESTATPQPTRLPASQTTPTPTPSADEPDIGTPTYSLLSPTPLQPTATVRRTETGPTLPPPTTQSPRPSSTTQAPPNPTTQAPPEPTTPVTPQPSRTTEAPPKPVTPTAVELPTKTTEPPPDTPKPTNPPTPKPTDTQEPEPTVTQELPPTPVGIIPTKPTIP